MTLPTPREPRDLRYRRQFFPGADEFVFQTGRAGFVPLPILLRKLMRYLNAPEFRLLVYLHLRASRYGICFPSLEEIAHEIGLNGRKNITPHLKSLEDKKAISSRAAMGRKYYLVHDPRIALRHLIDTGHISDEELLEINALCEDLGQQPLEPVKKRARHAQAGKEGM